MRECIKANPTLVGSDKLLSVCLWRLGYAFTDPSCWLERGLDSFHTIFVSCGVAWERRNEGERRNEVEEEGGRGEICARARTCTSCGGSRSPPCTVFSLLQSSRYSRYGSITQQVMNLLATDSCDFKCQYLLQNQARCVCVREGERERGAEHGRDWESERPDSGPATSLFARRCPCTCQAAARAAMSGPAS
jgi:hypothetical protein